MPSLKNNPVFAGKINWLTGEAEEASVYEKIRLGRVSGYMVLHKKPEAAESKGLKFHPFMFKRSPVCFCISKKSVNAELPSSLRQAFATAKARGDFEKVTAKYE